jgi:hypothetical protein
MTSSVRRAAKHRTCDSCSIEIGKGTSYFATNEHDPYEHPGPHVGWWYYCLPCAETLGHIAPVARRAG